MKKWICLPLCALLLAALFCTSQAQIPQADENAIRVYFVSDSAHSSSALVWESRVLDPNQDAIQQLVTWLLAGPEAVDHEAILPGGVTLISRHLAGTTLTLNFSNEYSDLTGADLTLANAAVVMTLTQLEEVEGVVILSAGEPVLADSTVPLTAENFDLSGRSSDPVTIKLSLYFLSENGTDVISESREIQASDDSVSAAAQAVLDTLCAGPTTKGLRSFLPNSTDGISFKIKKKTCTLTIDDQWRSALLDSSGKATLSTWALTASLTGLDGIDLVTYEQDGTEVSGLSDKEIAAVYNSQ